MTAIESQAVLAKHAPPGSSPEQCAVATAQGRRAELNRMWHVITHCIGWMFTALANDPLIAQACEDMLGSDVMYLAIRAGADTGQPFGSADPRDFKRICDAALAANSAGAARSVGAIAPLPAATAGAHQEVERCGLGHATELCYSSTDYQTKLFTRLDENNMIAAAKALKAHTLANWPCRARHDSERGDGEWEHDRGYDRRGRPGYAEEPRERGRETSRDTRGAGFGGERGRPLDQSGSGGGDRSRN